MPHRPELTMTVLGSGSAGNAIAVTDGSTTLLVDCGFSAREVSHRLRTAGIEPASVCALLLTHEHGDHVRGVDVFCRRHAPNCVVHASAGTLRSARCSVAGGTRHLRAGEVTTIGTLTVLPFATSHDATEPLGFRIGAGGHSLGLVTDTGVLTEECLEALAGCDTLGIESNHDVEMLDNGPYPYYLKRRIHSARGHLSNEAAASALEALASSQLRHVIGLHRSRTNNTSDLAAQALTSMLARVGSTATVTIARQDAMCTTTPAQRSLFDESA